MLIFPFEIRKNVNTSNNPVAFNFEEIITNSDVNFEFGILLTYKLLSYVLTTAAAIFLEKERRKNDYLSGEIEEKRRGKLLIN